MKRVLILVLLFCGNASSQAASMKLYVNVDFGFELSYPAEYDRTDLPYNVAVMCANNGLEALLYVSTGTSQQAGSILVTLDRQEFSLAAISARYTHGADNPETRVIRKNTFYYFGGGGGVDTPDDYLYDLDGRILRISFDWPNTNTPSEQKKQIEQSVLETFHRVKPANVSSGPHPPAINVYEDEDVRLTILSGWGLQPRYEENGDRGVLLTNGNYKLLLRYHTGHASGIAGGRLSEALKLPWLDHEDDALDCSTRLRASEPRTVNPTMRFYSLILDGSDCETRVDCRIKWKKIGEHWVGGYFSPEDGGYFFGPHDSRAFTLIYDTNAPDYLPVKGDAITERVIGEAAKIVNSIQYKTPQGH